MLYFIKSSKYFKIGFAKDVESRMGQYNTCNPDYELLDTAEGTQSDETQLHRRLKKYLIGDTEWMKMNPEIVDVWLAYKKNTEQDYYCNITEAIDVMTFKNDVVYKIPMSMKEYSSMDLYFLLEFLREHRINNEQVHCKTKADLEFVNKFGFYFDWTGYYDNNTKDRIYTICPGNEYLQINDRFLNNNHPGLTRGVIIKYLLTTKYQPTEYDSVTKWIEKYGSPTIGPASAYFMQLYRNGMLIPTKETMNLKQLNNIKYVCTINQESGQQPEGLE